MTDEDLDRMQLEFYGAICRMVDEATARGLHTGRALHSLATATGTLSALAEVRGARPCAVSGMVQGAIEHGRNQTRLLLAEPAGRA